MMNKNIACASLLLLSHSFFASQAPVDPEYPILRTRTIQRIDYDPAKHVQKEYHNWIGYNEVFSNVARCAFIQVIGKRMKKEDEYNFPLLTILRSRDSVVGIRATAQKEHILKKDKNGHEGFISDVWLPWQTDVIPSPDATEHPSVQTLCKLRGGNRLHIEYSLPCAYEITVPHDADLDVLLEQGKINYLSSESTNMTVTATDIVASYPFGMLGMLKTAIFKAGSHQDPVTILETKRGSITAPPSFHPASYCFYDPAEYS